MHKVVPLTIRELSCEIGSMNMTAVSPNIIDGCSTIRIPLMLVNVLYITTPKKNAKAVLGTPANIVSVPHPTLNVL